MAALLTALAATEKADEAAEIIKCFMICFYRLHFLSLFVA